MFRLTQKSINKSIAKFQVLDQSGDIVGSINVPVEQIDGFLKQWMGPVDRSSSPRMSASVPTVRLAKPRRMSRAFILRGC